MNRVHQRVTKLEGIVRILLFAFKVQLIILFMMVIMMMMMMMMRG